MYNIQREKLWRLCAHSHKKRKDNLEIWATLLIFLLELEISWVVVQRIHQNSKKWLLF